LLWGLGAVLAADVALLYFIYRSGGAGPRAARERVQLLRLEHKLLAADVQRVAAIRDRLPEVRKQCDKFFAEKFLTANSGYSAIVADLAEVAREAGLQASSVTFKQRELDKRGIREVSVAAAVEGSYASLVKFINGLERSDNFYLIESFSMAPGTDGAIKLNLQLKSYLRT
jgi:Tfp pilus assembly protein PilO